MVYFRVCLSPPLHLQKFLTVGAPVTLYILLGTPTSYCHVPLSFLRFFFSYTTASALILISLFFQLFHPRPPRPRSYFSHFPDSPYLLRPRPHLPHFSPTPYFRPRIPRLPPPYLLRSSSLSSSFFIIFLILHLLYLRPRRHPLSPCHLLRPLPPHPLFFYLFLLLHLLIFFVLVIFH